MMACSCPAEFSPMALVISERSTSSGMMACLAGSMKANSAPWMVEATRMWYQVTVSVMTEMASARAIRASAPWKSWISRLRCIRSAIAPPNRASDEHRQAVPDAYHSQPPGRPGELVGEESLAQGLELARAPHEHRAGPEVPEVAVAEGGEGPAEPPRLERRCRSIRLGEQPGPASGACRTCGEVDPGVGCPSPGPGALLMREDYTPPSLPASRRLTPNLSRGHTPRERQQL